MSDSDTGYLVGTGIGDVEVARLEGPKARRWPRRRG